MSLRKIKSELKTMSQEQLIEFITDLYKRMPNVKSYLDLTYGNKYDIFIEKNKKKIERLLYPTGRVMTFKDKEARKLIKEINRMEIPEISCELEFYYVECALDVLDVFGYSDNSFFRGIYSAFNSAISNMNKINNYDKYEDRINKIQAIGYDHGMDLDY